jgi:hypothetical protein
LIWLLKLLLDQNLIVIHPKFNDDFKIHWENFFFLKKGPISLAFDVIIYSPLIIPSVSEFRYLIINYVIENPSRIKREELERERAKGACG